MKMMVVVMTIKYNDDNGDDADGEDDNDNNPGPYWLLPVSL